MEKCVKCGEKGEDRRILWMSCFYSMSEMKGIPFSEVFLYGIDSRKVKPTKKIKCTSTKLDKDGKEIKISMMIPSGEYTTKAKFRRKLFYTLRVCKECRADWMKAIENWFVTPKEEQNSCGSGIFVRDMGVNKEITYREWARLNSQRIGDKTSG